MATAHYLCPICQQNLTLADKTYRCVNNHAFDEAKEGYVNLLPVQHKHSKDPGDNKAMVNARRAFLDKGFYQPLLNSIIALQHKYGGGSNTILDAGCGEGFYTHQHKTPNNNVYGVDIAKTAVKLAAKRYKDCSFSVGTLSSLPFESGFFNWIFSIYAPILPEEFKRVLAENGYLLTVTPAENHLFELKQLIYRQVNTHDTTKIPVENLVLVEETTLSYVMEFSQGDDIINLLSMTPFAFKTTPELIEKLKNTQAFTCQADFLIRVYKN